MDRGEGQHWNRAPGNLYSLPEKITFDPVTPDAISIELDQVIPPIVPPEDSKYVKHIRIRSELLERAWVQDMYLGPTCCCPRIRGASGCEIPLVPSCTTIFLPIWRLAHRTPDATSPEYSDRFQMDCYNRIVQQEAYDFTKNGRTWLSRDRHRDQHANPTTMTLRRQLRQPGYLRRRHYDGADLHRRTIPGYRRAGARFTYGGSTGGWEALLPCRCFYPMRSTFATPPAPDPIDFRHYVTVNIYEDKNAYWIDGDFRRTPRPNTGIIWYITALMKDYNQMELALGTNSRPATSTTSGRSSTGRWEDGYPKPIWDKYMARSTTRRNTGRNTTTWLTS